MLCPHVRFGSTVIWIVASLLIQIPLTAQVPNYTELSDTTVILVHSTKVLPPESALFTREPIGAAISHVDESEPNDSRSLAQGLYVPAPVVVSGSVEPEDEGNISVEYPSGVQDDIEDIYAITTTAEGLTVVLDSLSQDVDLFIFDREARTTLGFSGSHSGDGYESISLFDLPASSYLIGVTIYDPEGYSPPEADEYVMTVGGVLRELEPLQPTVFVVNSDGDYPDENVADGACISTQGGCTLRAAIQQSNSEPGDWVVEIRIQVPQIVVESWYGPLRIARDNVEIIGPFSHAECERYSSGNSLPVDIFPDSGDLGAILKAGTSAMDDFNGVEVAASGIWMSGFAIEGFETGIRAESGNAIIKCMDIHGAEKGIVATAPTSVSTSVVRGNRIVGISHEFGDSWLGVSHSCIGTLADCETPDGNGVGIEAGGRFELSRSVVSGNDIGLSSSNWGGDPVIRSNFIGTDHSGSKDVGNRIGIFHRMADEDITKIENNVISGNDEIGIRCSYCAVKNNFIGTSASGKSAIPNGAGVILEADAGDDSYSGSLIDNVISGNTGVGATIEGGADNKVEGNFIGTGNDGRPLGNGGHGILIPDNYDYYPYAMYVGGDQALGDKPNTIAYNGGDGIHIGSASQVVGKEAYGVWARRNSIFSNGGLGIGLEGLAAEVPTPIIRSADVQTNGDVLIRMAILAESTEDFAFELYCNDESDPSGFGEGQFFVWGGQSTGFANGYAERSATISSGDCPNGKWLTASATLLNQVNAYDNEWHQTSQFSNAVRVIIQTQVEISVDPDTLQFGDVPVAGSKIDTVRITNAGDAELTGSVSAAPDFLGNAMEVRSGLGAFNLTSGMTLDVVIEIHPASVGAKNSTISITHNATNEASPITVRVLGHGIPTAAAGISAEPSSYDFGQVDLGESADKVILVKSTGTGVLSGSVQGGIGFPASGFRVVEGGGEYLLDGGTQKSVKVRFTPPSVGEKSGVLRVLHNASGVATPYEVSLSGTGVVDTPLEAPILVSPPNGATEVDIRPTFLWRSASGATSYKLMVSREPNVTSPVIDRSETDTTSGNVELAKETTYYWSVTSSHLNESADSDIWSFTTGSGPNNDPIAEDDSLTVSVGVESVLNVLANDSDPDGDQLQISGLTEFPINGSVSYTNSEIRYAPFPGFLGNDRLTYTIEDGRGGTGAAKVYIKVAVETASGSDYPESVTALHQNYPNPFSERTKVVYTLAEPGHVRLELLDIIGRTLRVLEDGARARGIQEIMFDGSALPAGLYMLRFRTGDFTESRLVSVAH